KRHSRLGPVGRVWTSVCIRLGLPLTARMRLYRDHGTLAAAELADEDRTVTEFARHHHGQRPVWFDADDWELLVAADRPVLPPPAPAGPGPPGCASSGPMGRWPPPSAPPRTAP